MLAKAMRIFFFQSVKLIAMQIFRKKTFLSYPSSKNWKKNLHPDTQNAVATTLPKTSRQTSENHLLEFRKQWKNCAFSKESYFSSRCSSEHAHWNFDKPAVTLLARILKAIAKSKRDEYMFFWTKLIFFHQNWFFCNGECNFDNASKNFSLRIHKIAAQTPKTTKKTYEISKRKITSLKMFLCTCRMQLRTPCRNFLVEPLKTFCWNSGNDEKLISFPKKLFV